MCALYTSGVAFNDVDSLSNITLFELSYNRFGAKVQECISSNKTFTTEHLTFQSLERVHVLINRVLQECMLCGDVRFSRTGICITCDAGMCRATFHVTW